MLSEEARQRRRGKVTATVARNLINAQTDAELLKVFDRFIGALDEEPENYAMRAGTAMEPVIINEYELRTGEKLKRRQEIVDHPTIKDFCCTLDGWHASKRAVIEAKFASPFMSRDEIFQYYFPQVAFQAACTDAAEGVLVVGQGTSEPFELECIRDAQYEAELLERCQAFLLCAKTMTPPCARPMPMPPPEKWRTIDLAVDDPNWRGDLEGLLLAYEETAPFARQHEDCGKAARALIPDDVGKVFAGVYTITRNKKGTLAITRKAA